MSPVVVHFAADFSPRRRLTGSHYRRECLRLRLAERDVKPWLAGFAAHFVHGLPCAVVNAALRTLYI